MKRAKQLEYLIDDVNIYLKNNGIKNEANPVFLIVQHNLIQQGLYKGFNYFKRKEFDDGTVLSVLAGTSDPDKFDYLQLY